MVPFARHLAALLMLLIFGVLMALILTAQPAPSMAQFPPGVTPSPGQSIPGVTPTITLTPTQPLTPLPTSNAPGCDTVLPIEIGAIITVRSGVNIRYAPSVSSPWLANYQEPRNFTVLDGPECADNYIWWRVGGHGIVGWVAERSNTLNFITFIDASRVGGGECSAPLTLSVGEEIELVTGVRVRDEPGLQGLVLTVAPLGARAVVLDNAPQCNDGFNWRLIQVEVVDVLYEGWIAEGSSSFADELFIAQDQPDSICSPPMGFSNGDTGRIRAEDGIAKNLRSAPGSGGEILYTLVDNVPFEIIGGPVCVEDMIWWQVRIRSNLPAAGWVAQGPRPNFWLESDYVPSPFGVPQFDDD